MLSRPTERISRGDDAEQPPKWQVLCADSTGSGDINDKSKHPAQYGSRVLCSWQTPSVDAEPPASDQIMQELQYHVR